MDAHIPYQDAMQAATARSCAVRWLIEHDIVCAASIERQFGIGGEAVSALLGGAPLIVADETAAKMDRMVATQSLLLDGYSSDSMARWFRTPLPALDGLAASQLLRGEADATSDILEAAEAWMG